jgi:hypothetical protein
MTGGASFCAARFQCPMMLVAVSATTSPGPIVVSASLQTACMRAGFAEVCVGHKSGLMHRGKLSEMPSETLRHPGRSASNWVISDELQVYMVSLAQDGQQYQCRRRRSFLRISRKSSAYSSRASVLNPNVQIVRFDLAGGD